MDGHELKRTLRAHELIAKIYADDRFPKPGTFGDLRMFAITTVWVVGIERAPAGKRWERVAEVMHLDNFRFWRMFREDVPRFEPDRSADTGLCEAPMIRRDGPCGKNGTRGFRVTNPEDGTWRTASFCTRHNDAAHAAAVTERARRQVGGIPEPLPNRGGLLPCYIGLKSWPNIYAKAAIGDWKPPRVGICADDWPVMARVVDQEPPALKLVFGGREVENTPLPSGEAAAPALRLVTTT